MFRASTAVKGIHVFFDSNAGAEAVLIQAPTFNCLTIAGCYPEPSNELEGITLGY